MAVVSPMRAGSLLQSAPWRPPPLLAAPAATLAGPLGPAARAQTGGVAGLQGGCCTLVAKGHSSNKGPSQYRRCATSSPHQGSSKW